MFYVLISPEKHVLFFDGIIQCPVSLTVQLQSIEGPEVGGDDGANSIWFFADICSQKHFIPNRLSLKGTIMPVCFRCCENYDKILTSPENLMKIQFLRYY